MLSNTYRGLLSDVSFSLNVQNLFWRFSYVHAESGATKLHGISDQAVRNKLVQRRRLHSQQGQLVAFQNMQ